MARKRILRFGLPKGSLQEATIQKMAKAGFNISISERSYIPYVDDEELKNGNGVRSILSRNNPPPLNRNLPSRNRCDALRIQFILCRVDSLVQRL